MQADAARLNALHQKMVAMLQDYAADPKTVSDQAADHYLHRMSDVAAYALLCEEGAWELQHCNDLEKALFADRFYQRIFVHNIRPDSDYTPAAEGIRAGSKRPRHRSGFKTSRSRRPLTGTLPVPHHWVVSSPCPNRRKNMATKRAAKDIAPKIKRESAAEKGKRPPFECIALLLQGGGALGSYQGGVYEALVEHGIEPDWVAGISIGGINCAVIAGNPPEQRVQRLREFWEFIFTSPALSPFYDFLSEGDQARDAINKMSVPA